MIRKLKSGKYRLYSRKVDPKTGKLKNLGTFDGMMAHLMDVLSQGGRYWPLRQAGIRNGGATLPFGRPVVQTASALDPNLDEEKARALIEQVVTKGYSPPSREKVLEFQETTAVSHLPESERSRCMQRIQRPEIPVGSLRKHHRISRRKSWG